MTSRRLPRAQLLLLAMAGAVCGHTVAYGLTFPDRAGRESVLRLTGHAYWHAAVAAGVIAAVWFAAGHVHRHFAAGRSGQRVATPDILTLTARLAGLQAVLFLGMEVSERIAARAPVETVLHHRLLTVGLTIQVVVGALLALATRALACVAIAVGRVMRPEAMPRASFAIAAPVQLWPVPLAVAPCGSRGPPSS
jgi:hypothetical protein